MRKTALIALLSSSMAAACGGDQAGEAGSESAPDEETSAYEERAGIAEVLAEDERFSILTAALEAAEMGPVLEEGTYTLFAPTDSAFAQLPDGAVEALLDPANRATLDALLRYHLIPGRLIAVNSGQGSAETMSGESLPLDRFGGRLRVGGGEGAVVTVPAIEAANGLVHGIDRVLLPPES